MSCEVNTQWFERAYEEHYDKLKAMGLSDQEIDKLCEHEVVTTYFTREELITVFDFELQDPRFFTNIKTETKQ